MIASSSSQILVAICMAVAALMAAVASVFAIMLYRTSYEA